MTQKLGLNFPVQTWSRYKLDQEAYLIFLTLQNEPTIPVSKISQHLGFSTTLVTSRLQYLKDQGFLRPDKRILVPFLGQRFQTEVEAIYDYHKLGLKRYHVFFEELQSFSQVNYLEQLLALHPYTHYHIVTYSPSMTLYVQFDIPDHVIDLIDKLCIILQENGIIGSFHSFNEEIIARSEVDFIKWKIGTNNWRIYNEQIYDPQSSKTEIDQIWENYNKNSENKQVPEIVKPSWSFPFDEIDLKLLRELTVNGRPVVTELAKYYDISRSRLSRRLTRLKEKAVNSNRLVYDPLVFDLNYPQIIEGTFKATDEVSFNSLYHFVEGNHIPFPSYVVLNKNKFFWFMRVPGSLVTAITRFILEHAIDVKIHQLDPTTGQTSYFNHRNLKIPGEWIDDEEYIINQPLALTKA